MLRPEAIRERLLYLEEVVSRLEELHRADPVGPPAGFRDTWAVERGLQLAAETVFDIANHILSAHFGVSAQDYEDILARLGEVGWGHRLPPPRATQRARRLSKHPCPRVPGIDPERVRDALRRGPADFSDFAIAIRRWLEQMVA